MFDNRLLSQTKLEHHASFENPVIVHLVRHFPPFIYPKVSVLCPQQPASNL